MSDTRGASEPTPEQAPEGAARGQETLVDAERPTPVHALTPEPIEGDEGEVIPAVTPPGDDEILPTTGSIPFAPVSGRPVSPYDAPRADIPATDDVQRLGESAVTNASLAASGARPTAATLPTGWLRPAGSTEPRRTPAPPSLTTSEAPFTTDEAPFTPRFEPRTIFAPVNGAQPDPGIAEGAASEDGGAALAPALVAPAWATAGEADAEKQQGGDADASGEPEASDASPEPAEGSVTHPVTPETADDGEDDRGADGTGSGSEERPRASATVIVLLVLAGLVVWGGIGYALVLALSPDPVVIEAEIHVTGPAEATVEPIELTDATDFLAAMPLTAGVFSLVGVETLDPEDEGIPQRAAEVYDLQYTDGTDLIGVLAIQHYESAAAESAYQSLSEGAAPFEDVVDAAGEVVGSSAVLDDGETSAVVWRNGTAVFVATGDHDQLLELYRLYGL